MNYEKKTPAELMAWFRNWKRRYDKLERLELMPEQNTAARLRHELKMRMVNINKILNAIAHIADKRY